MIYSYCVLTFCLLLADSLYSVPLEILFRDQSVNSLWFTLEEAITTACKHLFEIYTLA